MQPAQVGFEDFLARSKRRFIDMTAYNTAKPNIFPNHTHCTVKSVMAKLAITLYISLSIDILTQN